MNWRLLSRLILAAGVLLIAVDGGAVKVKDLPENWRKWLEEEVYPLITAEQQKAFLALETEPERKEFEDRLWQVWGSQSGQGSSFRRSYQERLEFCRNEFTNTTEDRARVLLLHGEPDYRKRIDCDQVFNPLEFWVWARVEGLGRDVTVVFYQPYGMGRFRLWEPSTGEGRDVLYNFQGNSALAAWMGIRGPKYELDRPEYRCGDGQEILRLLNVAEFWLRDLKTWEAMNHALPQPGAGSKESETGRFLEFSTIMPKKAKPLAFEVATSVGERRGGKLAVTFAATVPRAGLPTAKVGDVDVVQIDVTGEISGQSEMVDRFRYAFTFPAVSSELPVAIERELRPGRYHVRMRVQDSTAAFAAVREADFEVTMPEVSAPAPPDAAMQSRLDRVARATEASLMLQGPEGDGISGVQRFDAMVGPRVARVEFLLDGKLVLTKNRPPFEVELDLGPLPRLATVAAVAYDDKGVELDRRKLDLNVGRERFLVRLQPVSASDRQGGRVRAQVTVNVPSDRKLAKLEIFWNEQLAATLFAPPFDAWLSVKDNGSIGYLRALATLSDGGQAEDVEFVNAPQFLTGVQVATVELPVTVLDRAGKPVEGLKEEEFEVLEDGARQSVSHFSLQRDLPVRMGLVIDTSGSMEKTLPEVQRVVLGFLRNLLRPKDRALVVAFSDRPALLEGFTADFGALERALISLRADRETALYDATVFGLFQFSGVRGRKAMVILTDGEDNASRMTYDRAYDYAQRSGVSVYTIGIDLPITKVGIRSQLTRLARTTGGEAFFLPRGAALDSVYATINRELRSQYLLAYTSTSDRPPDVFRKVTVRVKRPKVEVRTIAGYYPGG